MRLLFDEKTPPLHQNQFETRMPEVSLLRVGDPDAPPSGTSDPVLLRWYEASDAVLVTADRASMPEHFERHLSRGGHLPGVLVVRPRVKPGDVLDTLELICSAATTDDLQKQFIYIPLL